MRAAGPAMPTSGGRGGRKCCRWRFKRLSARGQPVRKYRLLPNACSLWPHEWLDSSGMCRSGKDRLNSFDAVVSRILKGGPPMMREPSGCAFGVVARLLLVLDARAQGCGLVYGGYGYAASYGYYAPSYGYAASYYAPSYYAPSYGYAASYYAPSYYTPSYGYAASYGGYGYGGHGYPPNPRGPRRAFPPVGARPRPGLSRLRLFALPPPRTPPTPLL